MSNIEPTSPRSFRFPNAIWDALETDARRCKRSVVKQLEAILETYYGLNESIEINGEAINQTRSSISNLQPLSNGNIKLGPATEAMLVEEKTIDELQDEITQRKKTKAKQRAA